MNSFLARQPILDKKLQVKGYELLFRSGEQAESFSGTDADYATVETTIESFYTIGLETITGRKPAYIHFTTPLLLANVATLFPKDLLVIELQNDIEPTDEVIEICKELYKNGYTLAMEGYVFDPAYEPLLKLCKIIKIDFITNSYDQIKKILNHNLIGGKQLCAEKIESFDMFNTGMNMGFSLFQGYFFSKPVTVSSRRLDPLKMSYLNLINETKNPDLINYDRLARIIRHDIALCHKLLRMVNSVYYGFVHKVTSVKLALVILGINEIRKWIYFLSIMELGSGKPTELVRMSMIRGFFMESLGEIVMRHYTKDTFFMLGIFSLIDILLEQPMKTALADLQLPPEINEALIESRGELYELLQLIITIESGTWDETDRLAAIFKVNMRQITEHYLKAIRVCDEITI